MSNKIFKNHKTIALIFDSDGTLHEKYMFKNLFKKNNFSEQEFFDKIDKYREKLKENDILVEDTLVYFQKLIDFFKEKGKPLTNEALFNSGKELIEQSFPGMPEALFRYKEFVKDKYPNLNIIIENYIISSGSRKILQGSCFNKNIDQIYACDTYMENGKIKLSYPMSDTMKTQALFWINKGFNNGKINHNTYLTYQQRKIPFDLMIGFEDGETGIPMLKLIKNKGGTSVGVYEKDDSKTYEFMKRLKEQNKIHAYFEADYNENSSLDQFIKKEIENKVELIKSKL